MSMNRSLLATAALCWWFTAIHPANAADIRRLPSSEIRVEPNGRWLFVDGARVPAFAGAVYQNTEADKHVRVYSNSLHTLYRGLDDESVGGLGHGRRLAEMGIQAIRVYELPVENLDDVWKVKEIFRRLHSNSGIKVLVGDWAGLHRGMNFRNAAELSQLRAHLQKLIAAYAEEPWVLGWQLGNENNYHIRGGIFGEEIALSPEEYFSFMDGLAGVIKQELGNRHLTQIVSLGQGDLTEKEARLIEATKNFDAVGINCYREDPASFEQIIALAANQIRLPIYFAEIGRPAENAAEVETQSQYLQNVCSVILPHGGGGLRAGNVLGAFLHEATDEAWKRFERGQASDSHYGFIGKATELRLGQYLQRHRDFCTWILPTNDAPDTLIRSAWNCLQGPYTRRHARLYGDAMAYANRVITLYQDIAQEQQLKLSTVEAPLSGAAHRDYWAVNAVGTSYFIIGQAWMLQSFDYRGVEQPAGTKDWILGLADFRGSQSLAPAAGYDTAPTNSAGCVFYARQVFAALRTMYPYAHLESAQGSYQRLDEVVKSRFPELSAPYVPLSWKNLVLFVGSCLALILGLAAVSRWRAAGTSVPSEPAMSLPLRIVFLLALTLNLICLFWFVNWWFHPIRISYHTVDPVLFVVLSAIGGSTVLFYFLIWNVLWNMRRPVPMKVPEGRRVAIVTTRVASEAVEPLVATLRKMNEVAYPHDSYLLDEEDNADAKARCQEANVIHFSRKDKPQYNQPTGIFQARTKGGNLNSWLYEYGKNYDIVTFLDPDHAPRPEFLDKVLGYFEHPKVAFVQGPQVFHNRSESWIARGAAEQSHFFYGPIQMGLFGIGCCVVNGSHSTFRVSDLFALKENAYAVHDADDILTSVRVHAAGKVGVYVPEIIAEGLAPDNWDEFSKQQRRWSYSMFHLFFHYYLPELLGMPFHCKVVYLLLAWFYFMGIAFLGLLLMPFVSALTGNPAVNANIVAFTLRFLPFLALHFGILLFLGQRFLIPNGGQKGFWYRGGILWIAMWWGHLCALMKAIRVKKVTDRVVAAKWSAKSTASLRPVLPHFLLTIAATIAFVWTYLRVDRRETVWGTLIFLGIIAISQGYIVLRVSRRPKAKAPARQESPELQPLVIQNAYSQQPRRS
jgi:cellulose synthase (UDP-forming)